MASCTTMSGGDVPRRTGVSLTAEVTSRSFSITRGRLVRDPSVGTGVSTGSCRRGVSTIGGGGRSGDDGLGSSRIGTSPIGTEGDTPPPCPAAFAFPFPRERTLPDATDDASPRFPLLRFPFVAARSTGAGAGGGGSTTTGAGFFGRSDRGLGTVWPRQSGHFHVPRGGLLSGLCGKVRVSDVWIVEEPTYGSRQ